MLWRVLVENAAQAMKQVAARPAFMLLALSAWTGASQDDPNLAFPGTMRNRTSAARWCTAGELLPRQVPKNASVSPEWSTELVEPPYGCDCSFYRARYFCPVLGDEGYPAWVPHAVADGVCKTVTRSDLRQAPLPPNFKVLVYGNSHLRQVVEGMMCMFHEKVETKRVRYDMKRKKPDSERTVPGDAACRGCTDGGEILRDHGCIPSEQLDEGCDCTDDFGEFVFDNGATLHYYFAHMEKNKSLADALPSHGNVPWTWYDAVIANEGNSPQLSPDAVLAAAADLHEASVPFYWLNNYHGKGDVGTWEEPQRSRFDESFGKNIRIDAMTHGMHSRTKEAVEDDSDDSHFCLPGPPDEMALLLLKMMWAMHFEDIYW